MSQVAAISFTPPSNRLHVVIIGASFSGLSALQCLLACPFVSCTLIEPRSFFEYIPSIWDMLASPSLTTICLPPLTSTTALPAPLPSHGTCSSLGASPSVSPTQLSHGHELSSPPSQRSSHQPSLGSFAATSSHHSTAMASQTASSFQSFVFAYDQMPFYDKIQHIRGVVTSITPFSITIASTQYPHDRSTTPNISSLSPQPPSSPCSSTITIPYHFCINCSGSTSLAPIRSLAQLHRQSIGPSPTLAPSLLVSPMQQPRNGTASQTITTHNNHTISGIGAVPFPDNLPLALFNYFALPTAQHLNLVPFSLRGTVRALSYIPTTTWLSFLDSLNAPSIMFDDARLLSLSESDIQSLRYRHILLLIFFVVSSSVYLAQYGPMLFELATEKLTSPSDSVVPRHDQHVNTESSFTSVPSSLSSSSSSPLSVPTFLAFFANILSNPPPSHLDMLFRLAELQSLQAMLLSASNMNSIFAKPAGIRRVVVVGGGPTGIELFGLILDLFIAVRSGKLDAVLSASPTSSSSSSSSSSSLSSLSSSSLSSSSSTSSPQFDSKHPSGVTLELYCSRIFAGFPSSTAQTTRQSFISRAEPYRDSLSVRILENTKWPLASPPLQPADLSSHSTHSANFAPDLQSYQWESDEFVFFAAGIQRNVISWHNEMCPSDSKYNTSCQQSLLNNHSDDQSHPSTTNQYQSEKRATTTTTSTASLCAASISLSQARQPKHVTTALLCTSAALPNTASGSASSASSLFPFQDQDGGLQQQSQQPSSSTSSTSQPNPSTFSNTADVTTTTATSRVMPHFLSCESYAMFIQALLVEDNASPSSSLSALSESLSSESSLNGRPISHFSRRCDGRRPGLLFVAGDAASNIGLPPTARMAHWTAVTIARTIIQLAEFPALRQFYLGGTQSPSANLSRAQSSIRTLDSSVALSSFAQSDLASSFASSTATTSPNSDSMSSSEDEEEVQWRRHEFHTFGDNAPLIRGFHSLLLEKCVSIPVHLEHHELSRLADYVPLPYLDFLLSFCDHQHFDDRGKLLPPVHTSTSSSNNPPRLYCQPRFRREMLTIPPSILILSIGATSGLISTTQQQLVPFGGFCSNAISDAFFRAAKTMVYSLVVGTLTRSSGSVYSQMWASSDWLTAATEHALHYWFVPVIGWMKYWLCRQDQDDQQQQQGSITHTTSTTKRD